jgi:putative membrane protein
MIAAFVFGFGILATVPAYGATGWFGAKFACVLGLAASTLWAGRLVRRFAEKSADLPTSRRLRLLNELPTLLMVVIVGLVVFKPF